MGGKNTVSNSLIHARHKRQNKNYLEPEFGAFNTQMTIMRQNRIYQTGDLRTASVCQKLDFQKCSGYFRECNIYSWHNTDLCPVCHTRNNNIVESKKTVVLLQGGIYSQPWDKTKVANPSVGLAAVSTRSPLWSRVPKVHFLTQMLDDISRIISEEDAIKLTHSHQGDRR